MQRGSSTGRVSRASRRGWRAGAAALALCTGLGSGGFTLTAAAEEAQPEASVLVFSKTAGFRHDSIPAGIEAIEQLGAEHNFAVDATEDAEAFTDDNLAGNRKSTRLNSSHVKISYAVFCLKKKKRQPN